MSDSDGTTHYIITCKDGDRDLIYGNTIYHSEKAAMQDAGRGDWKTFLKTTRWRVQPIKLVFINEKKEKKNEKNISVP